MHFTKRHTIFPGLFLGLFLFVTSLLTAQTTSTPFLVPDVNNADFHRKCGIDHVIEGKIATDPEYKKEVERFKKRIPEIVEKARNNASRSSSASLAIINVPVVVHVIHTGQPVGTGMNISDAQIEAQIAVLNEDFNALNGNFDETPVMWQAAIGNPEVNFCLAAIDPNGLATNGITRDNIPVTGTNINNSNIESVIKPATWWDSDEYYNIWVLPIPGTTAAGGTTGYAYYPTGGVVGTSTDGTVVDFNWFGGPGFGNSGSKTLTHETGHYLGLPHTFEGDACGLDDGFADTPDIELETSFYLPNLNCSPNNFPTGPTSCGNLHMYVNYMDYVNDEYCYTSFSNEQIALMRAILMGNTGGTGFVSRAPLANNAVSVCSFFNNDAGITAVNAPGTFVCGGGQITPEVVITNFGQSNLNSVTINYQINNNAPVSVVHATNLPTAGMETVSLAPYTPPAGAYLFRAYTTLPNGMVDEQLENDTSDIISTVAVVPLPLPLQENFENPAFNPTINGVFTFDISGDGVVWQRSTAASGFGNGTASAMFDNYTTQRPNGTLDALITPIYDFSTVTGGQITFDVGYAIYQDPGQTLTDTLIMLVSTNCGTNFTQQIFVKGGAQLATAPPTTGIFTPTPAQWRTETVDLSAFDGLDNLTIMFVNFHGFGNRLFIDNINISLPCALTVTESHVDVDCFGDCTGSAIVNPSGGTGAYTYQWDANANNATTQSVNSLCAGTYMVTISNGPGCTAVQSVTISENPLLSATVTGTNETAVGANDGTATANPTGGNNFGYDFSWSNTGTTPTITGLAPNTYTVTITDASGCTFVDAVTIEPYDCGPYGITVLGTDVSCNGANDGTVSASVNAGAGTAPFTYNWSNAAGNVSMISSLTPGQYFVTVTDDKGCSAAGSYGVLEPDPLTVSVTTTNETTAGANDGTATATTTGGTPAITLLWSNAATTGMISNLSPGTYTVTATDSEGCTAIASGTVNSGAVDCSGFSISIPSFNNVNCNGDCNGNITLTVNSTETPFTFDWDDNTLDGTQNPVNLCPGTYTVTVTDNAGCSASLTQVIGEPSPLVINWLASNINCFGDCTGEISYTGEGGSGSYIATITGGSFTNLCAGNYDLVMTDDNGCSISASVPVTEFGPDNITSSATGESCFGDCDGTITISAMNNGPYTYNWSNGATGAMQTGLCAGAYNITITNAQACSTVISETVVEPAEIMISASTTPITAAGANDGTATATASGGTSTLTYTWQPNGEVTPTIGPLAPGTYTVVVTDANNCTMSETVVINPFDCAGFSANITATTNVLCFGNCTGAIATSITGGTAPITYVWSDASLNGQASPTNLCAGNYSVTISESNGCSAILNTTITEPAELTVSVNGTPPSAPGANDGTATATPSGGTINYTYQWSPNGETTAGITNLAPDTYIVMVTDANGCTATGSYVISGIDCSTFEIGLSIVNSTCFGGDNGTASVVPTGGAAPYNIIWDNASTNTTITDLGPGTYEVLVSDNNGCTIQQSFNITESPLLEVSISGTNETTAGANDGTAMVTSTTGGTPNYTYLWCDNSMGTSVMNLPPGVCGVTVTDANGCTSTASVIIGAGGVDCSDLAGTITTTGISCFGDGNGVADLTVVGGMMPMTYLWSNAAVTEDLFNVASGLYSVTVTDANGCQIITDGFVETPEPIMANITSTNETSNGASDGTATVNNTTGGTPGYNYLWCNGSTTNPVTNLPAGTCGLTVTDANGCSETFEVIIGSDAIDCSDLIATINTTEVSCFGGSDGVVDITITGGTMPMTYLWSNMAVTEDLFNVTSGVYSVTVTDFNGCQVIVNGLVGTPAPIMSNITFTNETTTGASDGTATVSNITGGTPGYTFVWCNGQTTATATGLPAGSCAVTITDTNGCTFSGSVTIGSASPDCSTFNATLNITDVTCFEGSDGSLEALVTGGTQPYNYNWSTASNAPVINGLTAGLYFVTITDSNGCLLILNGVVAQPAVLGAAISTTMETAPGASDATGTATPTGGTSPYDIQWCDGQTGETATNMASGFCDLIITDANGCTFSETLFFPPATVDCSNFGAAVVTQNLSCFEAGDGSANTVLTGGTAPFTYLWSTGAMTTAINNLPAGNYSVTVVDADGCEVVESGNVSQPAEIIYNIAITPETAPGANDGTATLTPSGGIPPYSFLWCNGQTTATATNLAGGVCNFTVTDAIGCSIMGDVFIETIPSDCSGFGMMLNVNSVSCFNESDGMITVQASGGTLPYVYNWSNGANTASISNLSAGPYSVTVTDALDCEITAQEVVSQPLPMLINTIAYDGNCGQSGAALATVAGGAEPYTYNWSNGMTGSFIDNLNAGVYQVTVTDANGCTEDGIVLIQVNSAGISIESDIDGVSCFGESDGNIDITVTSGTPPFTFQWDNGATTEDLFNRPKGTYSVFVLDAAGCLFGTTFEIGSPAPLTVGFATSPADNGSNGSATALGSGGTTPYSYDWDGAQTATISNLSTGSYFVTITDANGCTASGSVLLGTSSTNEIAGLVSFNIYPNPTDGAFAIETVFSENKKVEVLVYNVLGQMVFNQKEEGMELLVPVDIRAQAAGTYLVVLKTERGVMVRKVVKE